MGYRHGVFLCDVIVMVVTLMRQHCESVAANKSRSGYY